MKISPNRKNERGEGQIGSMIGLVVMIALAVAAFNIGPLYWQNYQFEDKLTSIAGSFPPNKDGDIRAMAAVKNAVAEAELLPYLDPETCSVTSAGGIGGLRTVSCTYTRDYKLFGSPKSVTFEVTVSRPMF